MCYIIKTRSPSSARNNGTRDLFNTNLKSEGEPGTFSHVSDVKGRHVFTFVLRFFYVGVFSTKKKQEKVGRVGQIEWLVTIEEKGHVIENGLSSKIQKLRSRSRGEWRPSRDAKRLYGTLTALAF